VDDGGTLRDQPRDEAAPPVPPDNFHDGVTLSVWRPSPGWTGFSGTAAEALTDYLRSRTDVPDVYVCGPPKLLEAVTGVAREHGIPDAQIIAERVFAS
jgi:NAD(P)H-flavin reductase